MRFAPHITERNWNRSRLYLAWSNRCLRCLLDPFHG